MTEANAPKEAKEPKEKKEKKEKKPAAPAEAPAAAKAEAPKAAAPRKPADPRQRLFNRLDGRHLPKGPLRDRLKAITARWHADADRGGVTLDELKALHQDWMKARQA